MSCTSHIRPTRAMGFPAQGIGMWFAGNDSGSLRKASAQAGVVATK